MADDKKAPIIKKIKKVAGGHHGGAWKIAYADFVTAMMAFFLLLWLLTTTPSQTLQGIADYFAPTIGLKDKMGIGFYGGKTPLEEGNSRNDFSYNPSIRYGVPNAGPKIKDPSESKAEGEEDAADNTRFEQVIQDLQKAITQDSELQKFRENILITITAEGLRISIVDQDKVSMFKLGSAELEPHTKVILQKILEIVKKAPNNIQISGHTDSLPYSNDKGYSNWELSADRANASRRYVESLGFDKNRIARVLGMADREHIIPDNPKSPINRRISVVLLYKSISPYAEKSAPEVFFKDQKADTSKMLDVKTEDKVKMPKNIEVQIPKQTKPKDENIQYKMENVDKPIQQNKR